MPSNTLPVSLDTPESFCFEPSDVISYTCAMNMKPRRDHHGCCPILVHKRTSSPSYQCLCDKGEQPGRARRLKDVTNLQLGATPGFAARSRQSGRGVTCISRTFVVACSLGRSLFVHSSSLQREKLWNLPPSNLLLPHLPLLHHHPTENIHLTIRYCHLQRECEHVRAYLAVLRSACLFAMIRPAN